MTADFSTWHFPHWLDETDRKVNALTRGAANLADLAPWTGARVAFCSGLDPAEAAFMAALQDPLLSFFLAQAPRGVKK